MRLCQIRVRHMRHQGADFSEYLHDRTVNTCIEKIYYGIYGGGGALRYEPVLLPLHHLQKQFSDLEADQLFDMISQVDTGCHGRFAGRELLPPAHGHVLTGKVDTCCHGLFAGRELLPPAL